MELTQLPRLELSRLHEQLGRLLASNDPAEETLRAFLEFTLSLVNGGAAAIHCLTIDGLRAKELIFSRQAKSWSDNLREEIDNAARRTLDENKAILTPLRRTANATIISVPLTGGCLSVVLLPGIHTLEIFVAILQLLAITIGRWMQRGSEIDDHGSLSCFSALVLLVTDAMEENKKELAAALFASRLQELLQADTVVLAVCPEGKKPSPVAISSLSDFSRQSPAVLQIQQVLDECQLHGKRLAWPATDSPEEIASPIVRGLGAEYGAEQVLCLPLFDKGGKSSGVLIVIWHTLSPELRVSHLRLMAASERILGSFCRWLGPPGKPALGRFSRLPRKQKIFISSALLLVVFLLCGLPVPYTISADCVLMPRTTRYVVAQFDSILQKVDWEVGTIVKKGQELAHLESQAIDLETSSLQAEIGKSRKLQDVYMVAGRTASAQIARLEGERLAEKLKLLQHQSTMLTIHSPVDGVIISGAVEKAEGGPVHKGQTLFEIAPLDQMIVELHIHQEDFQYVSTEYPLTINFESYPGDTWVGKINTIHPRTELRDGKYVFLAQCILDNKKGVLQPGMNGKAHIKAGLKPLIWQILRKPWTALQKIFG